MSDNVYELESKRLLTEGIAAARRLLEPQLGECDIKGSWDASQLHLSVKPRAWRGVVGFWLRGLPQSGWDVRQGKMMYFRLTTHGDWEQPAALAFLKEMNESFQHDWPNHVRYWGDGLAQTDNEKIARMAHALLMVLDESRAAECDATLAAALERIEAA